MSHCIDKLVVSSVMTKSAHSNIRLHIHHRNLKGSAWPAEKTLIIHRKDKKTKNKERQEDMHVRAVEGEAFLSKLFTFHVNDHKNRAESGW